MSKFFLISGTAFLAAFFVAAMPALAADDLPFAVSQVGGTERDCTVGDDGSVDCRASHRLGEFSVVFPAGTRAVDGGQIEIAVREIGGLPGLRVDGAIMPEGEGVTLTLPRPSGDAGAALCVRDRPGESFVSAVSPCMEAYGQGTVRLYPRNGRGTAGFYLNDWKLRMAEYDEHSVTLTGLRNSIVDFHVNTPPEVNDDSCATFEDEPVTCNVLGNDVDFDGDKLEILEVARPFRGHAYVRGGSLVYTPDSDWWGTDRFLYTVSDGEFVLRGAVEIVVESVNDPPDVEPDEVALLEDEEATFDVIFNDHDRDSAGLSLVSVGRPENGKVTTSGNLVTYVPKADWFGQEELEYTVEDSAGAKSIGIVSVSVLPVNDPPTVREASVRTLEDEPASGRVTGSDIDSEDLIFFPAVQPLNGHLDLKEDGSFTYMPMPDYFGEDSFSFMATDGTASSKPAVVKVSITQVYDGLAETEGVLSPTRDTSNEDDSDAKAVAEAIDGRSPADNSEQTEETVAVERPGLLDLVWFTLGYVWRVLADALR